MESENEVKKDGKLKRFFKENSGEIFGFVVGAGMTLGAGLLGVKFGIKFTEQQTATGFALMETVDPGIIARMNEANKKVIKHFNLQ